MKRNARMGAALGLWLWLLGTTVGHALGPDAMRPGFDENELAANDDGSTDLVPLGFELNFFGMTFDSLFVNNNGNVTFNEPLGEFTPFDLSSTGRAIIAPFFADVDTRQGNVVTYGNGVVAGRPAFGVNWPGVGCFAENTSVLNFFQLLLIDRSDVSAGAFDIELNYDQIQWETGEASGGDGNCLGGSAARVGLSNGSGEEGTSFELEGSGTPGAFLDSNPDSGLIHGGMGSEQRGRYAIPVRGGAPELAREGCEHVAVTAECSGARSNCGFDLRPTCTGRSQRIQCVTISFSDPDVVPSATLGATSPSVADRVLVSPVFVETDFCFSPELVVPAGETVAFTLTTGTRTAAAARSRRPSLLAFAGMLPMGLTLIAARRKRARTWLLVATVAWLAAGTSCGDDLDERAVIQGRLLRTSVVRIESIAALDGNGQAIVFEGLPAALGFLAR